MQDQIINALFPLETSFVEHYVPFQPSEALFSDRVNVPVLSRVFTRAKRTLAGNFTEMENLKEVENWVMLSLHQADTFDFPLMWKLCGFLCSMNEESSAGFVLAYWLWKYVDRTYYVRGGPRNLCWTSRAALLKKVSGELAAATGRGDYWPLIAKLLEVAIALNIRAEPFKAHHKIDGLGEEDTDKAMREAYALIKAAAPR